MPTEWHNWAGDQRCRPAEIVWPVGLGELCGAVKRASARGQTVRVAGSGHSFTDIACTDGMMLRLERLNRVLDVDSSSGLVKVEGGIGLHELNERLDEFGLALENLGDIDRQTLAGAISTATHGTGAGFRNLSSLVESMEIVIGDGTVIELSAESDPDEMCAARVGLGALGVIATLTLRTVPTFTLKRVDSPRPLDEVLGGLDEMADGTEHFEFFVFPHTDVALCIERERVDLPPSPPSAAKRYLSDVLVENHLAGLLSRGARRFPSQIPRLARFAASQLGNSTRIDRSYRVFANERRIRFTEMEYAIPREHAADAVRRVLELVPRRGFDVSFPIEVRFLAADDAYLSTAFERDTAYVAVHMYERMEWEPYFRGVEAIMDSYEGRPHWGKRHFQTAETLAPRYPEWKPFQKLRRKLDPQGRFANEYTNRVLGPVG